jgi:two-component system, OmpR family, catabolic regulation response regulator CreB
MRQKILVVEDEAAIADTIVYALETDGFDSVWASTGAEGRSFLKNSDISLVILDIGLPDISGTELCKEIRQHSTVPIIFLTARNDEIDRVVGLEIGGDDYIAKPFSPRELTARVRAVLRRFQPSSEPPPAVHAPEVPQPVIDTPFLIDEARMSVSYFDVPLELTRCEFRLLRTLINHPGRVYSRESLKETAWDEPEFSLDRTVDTHIKTIRGKLRAIRPDRDPIETRRGFGYALRESW